MDEKKLTVRQQRFVREVVKTGNGVQSLTPAGYNPTTLGSAKAMASTLLRKPKVQSAIVELLDQMHPNLDLECVTWIAKALKAPIKGSAEDDGSTPPQSWSDKLASITQISRLKQWMVSRSEHISADVTESLKLPIE